MITDSYAEEHAVYFENSWNDEASPAGGWTTRKPGSKRANGLGIHDMLGNVAELIIMEDGRTGFVGGHCESEANELGPTIIFEPSETLQHGFRPSYPDWVYHDGPPCGLRLICSAKSVRKTLGQQNNAPTQQNE